MARTQVTKSYETLTLEGARKATQACEKKANEIGVPMNIAVVDNSLHLLQFSRYVLTLSLSCSFLFSEMR